VPDKYFTIEQILTMLAEAPPRIAALIAGLAPAQLRAAPGPDEWSANDVLAHLRACADIWGDCIATIIAEDKPTIRAINPRTWIRETDYLELEFQASFRSFNRQRARLLKVLKGLRLGDWSRTATLTGAGKPLERTVLYYADSLARHERPHVKQIERILNAVQIKQ
jgi:hypothetical protein